MKYVFALLALLFLIASFSQGAHAEESLPVPEPVDGKSAGLHAEPWAFGHSSDRKAPIWAKGQTGKSLLPTKKKSAEVQADEQEEGKEKAGARSSLGWGMKDETGTWKVTPSQKDIRPDENRVRENRHILGAYADVQAGNDFNIRVGPELILKDDSHGDDSAYTEQPDSALGLGMKFKYDF